MKNSKQIIRLLALFLIALPLLNSCKKDDGRFLVIRSYSRSIRSIVDDTSYIEFQGQFAADNQVAGKASYWEFELFTEDNDSVLKVTSDNYKTLPFELKATTSPAPGFSIGEVNVTPTNTINGDIFDGKKPAKVIFRTIIIDENDSESEIYGVAQANHFIIDESQD